MNAEALSMRSIASAVAEKHRMTLTALKSKSRQKEISRPRQEAMALMYETGRWSLPQIGMFFGLNHTSVRYGVLKHQHRAHGAPPPKRYARHGPPRSRATRPPSMIITINGNQDGIRWGTLQVDGIRRSFFHDRLNGYVRLYKCADEETGRLVMDRHAERRAVACAMLDAAWAMERGAQ